MDGDDKSNEQLIKDLQNLSDKHKQLKEEVENKLDELDAVEKEYIIMETILKDRVTIN